MHPDPGAAAPASPAGARPLSQTELGARLLRRLDAARERPTRETVGALRVSVTELADRMRALDLPVERLAAAVESMLREHGVARPRPALHADDAPPRREISHVLLLDWAERAYRDDPWW